MMNRIFLLLLALVLVCSLSLTALAHEVPDTETNGSITFIMEKDGVKLNTGSLSIYRVGDIVEDDGNYSFALIEELQSYAYSLDNPDNPELAKELKRLALNHNLTEISAQIRDGEAYFSNVAPGMYVVVQHEDQACDGYFAIAPFLISVPQNEDGHYIQNVEARPKVPMYSAPTEGTEPPPTSEPPETTAPPKLPQTGQLNWPVPVMAVTGILLFLAGWILALDRKKEQ